MTRIYFRADGSSSIGLGHVYRSCALADMLRDHFECHFIIRNALPELKKLIMRYCTSVISLDTDIFIETDEAQQVAGLIRKEDILVLDGYHFTTDYQRIIKENVSCKLVSIDDIHECRYLSDVVISHIGGLRPSDFEASFYTEFFLGPRYALIRKEFIGPHEQLINNSSRDKHLLLFLGGSDPANDTLSVLQRLPVHLFADIHIITGAGYRYKEVLEQNIAETFPNAILHHNIEVDEVKRLMLVCGYAILAPSTVSYEYMSLGGVVFLHQIADNQTQVREFYLTEGLADDFQHFRILSAEEKKTMLAAQQKYFDGKSPERLLRIFRSLEFARNIVLRRVQEEDLTLVYEWVNDPQTRGMSYNSEAISIENHTAWFNTKIESAAHYYILEFAGLPLGQIRFEPDGANTFILGFLVAPPYRGQSLGSKVLAEGMKLLKHQLQGSPATVIGFVKKNNNSSIISFERLSFVPSETKEFPQSVKYSISI